MERSVAGSGPIQVPPPADRVEALAASARGWHTIQMAVLGFIGICGVLHTTSSSVPRTVQVLAAALAVTALAAAAIAIFAVGRVAYPIDETADDASALRFAAQATHRLHTGIRLTIVAVILAVIAALSGWWPAAAATSAVAVTGTSGQAWCGPLVNGPDGAISVRTGNGIISIPAQVISQV